MQLLLGGYNIHQMHRGGLQWRLSLGFSMYYGYGFQCSASLVYPSYIVFLGIMRNLRHIPLYFCLYASVIKVSNVRSRRH